MFDKKEAKKKSKKKQKKEKKKAKDRIINLIYLGFANIDETIVYGQYEPF